MPEICECRTDADLLDFYLSNRYLESITLINDVFKSKSSGIEELQQHLPLKVNRVLSRAKKIFVQLTNPKGNDWWIFWAYGMTGRIGEERKTHSHVEFKMSHSWIGFDVFYYTNQRRIACFVEASCDPERLDYHVSDMGKPAVLGYDDAEGFEPITEEEFIANIQAASGYLASKIMDQRTIASGIGNYLLSEIFYDAKLDPWVKCKDLSDDHISRLWKSVNKVINESYNNGGVSMSDYVHIDNTLGTHEHNLKVYERITTDLGEQVTSKKGPHGRTFWYVVSDHK